MNRPDEEILRTGSAPAARARRRISRRDFVLSSVGLGASLTSMGFFLGPTDHGAATAKALDVTYGAPTRATIKAAITDLIAGFTKAYGIQANYDPEPSLYADVVQKFTTYLASSYNGLDVLWIDDLMTASFGKSGWLVPLDKTISKSDKSALVGATVKLSRVNGHLVRVPTDFDTMVFLYRKDLFSAAGLKPPTTWKELISVGQRLTKGNTYALGMAAAPMGSLYNELCYWLPQAGGSFLKPTSKESRVALKFMHDLVNRYKMTPPDTISATPTTLQVSFAQGRIAMWPIWSGNIGTIVANLPQGTDPGVIGVAVPPKGPKSNATVSAAWGWSVSKFSQRVKDSEKFVRWVSSPESAVTLATTSQPPARSNLLGNAGVQKSLGPAGAALQDYAKHVPIKPRPIVPQTTRQMNAVQPILNSYLGNRMSLSAAVQQAEQALTRGH